MYVVYSILTIAWFLLLGVSGVVCPGMWGRGENSGLTREGRTGLFKFIFSMLEGRNSRPLLRRELETFVRRLRPDLTEVRSHTCSAQDRAVLYRVYRRRNEVRSFVFCFVFHDVLWSYLPPPRFLRWVICAIWFWHCDDGPPVFVGFVSHPRYHASFLVAFSKAK